MENGEESEVENGEESVVENGEESVVENGEENGNQFKLGTPVFLSVENGVILMDPLACSLRVR